MPGGCLNQLTGHAKFENDGRAFEYRFHNLDFDWAVEVVFVSAENRIPWDELLDRSRTPWNEQRRSCHKASRQPLTASRSRSVLPLALARLRVSIAPMVASGKASERTKASAGGTAGFARLLAG
ncbi:hypothetical protein [Tuwongella immobilis]|nr:hypothetical protein [Tuwongella immobilis]